jgi:hypothetical protein
MQIGESMTTFTLERLTPHRKYCKFVAISADGVKLAAGSYWYEENSAKVWRAQPLADERAGKKAALSEHIYRVTEDDIKNIVIKEAESTGHALSTP